MFVAEQLLLRHIEPSPSLIERLVWYKKILAAIVVLIYTCLFSVKFCFLCFFLPLIDRLKRMVIYWRFVLWAVAFAYGVCLVTPFIGCPHYNEKACKSSCISATLGLEYVT